ncbi:efflux RND transporter periplasmic adaptor subunit [uncultured Rhodoblastus sp.]|uniref:efflux RND transporter periplasmic adaptor subunit n=1 Tax=uncultured Rhodoblastus sp. TaxID=543037 RepID=UPI0025DB6E0F|nr:efflux RND transporter periplasmic adaptor subunit [uncultured Rhodoblastus sp.]
MRISILAALVFGGLAVPAVAQKQAPATQQQAQPAFPVGIVLAKRAPIAKTAEFVGRVEAIERVEIRARVTGFLESVNFREGEDVKQGAPLYSIEKDQFKAAVEQARGALERDKAAKTLAEIDLKRAQELMNKGSGTVVARDKARAADEQSQGSLTADLANLETAQINLRYTDIIAPIAGKVGKTNVTKGNVVGPDSGVLTTIVSQDPMRVAFPVSQREFLRAKSGAAKSGENGGKRETVKVQLRFSDGQAYDQSGTVDFIDVTVDRKTDTVLVRATFPNPDEILVDGQLVRVNLESDRPEEKVIVPQASIIADQEGVYVFIVEDGKAAVRRVTVGAEIGAGVVIEQGLSGGEQVIVQGLQGVRPGVAVRANPLPQTLVGD